MTIFHSYGSKFQNLIFVYFLILTETSAPETSPPSVSAVRWARPCASTCSRSRRLVVPTSSSASSRKRTGMRAELCLGFDINKKKAYKKFKSRYFIILIKLFKKCKFERKTTTSRLSWTYSIFDIKPIFKQKLNLILG
jgi:hypothetical protein